MRALTQQRVAAVRDVLHAMTLPRFGKRDSAAMRELDVSKVGIRSVFAVPHPGHVMTD